MIYFTKNKIFFRKNQKKGVILQWFFTHNIKISQKNETDIT